jgi:hypothetical protein
MLGTLGMRDFRGGDLRQRNRPCAALPLGFVRACSLNLVHGPDLDAILSLEDRRASGRHHSVG